MSFSEDVHHITCQLDFDVKDSDKYLGYIILDNLISIGSGNVLIYYV